MKENDELIRNFYTCFQNRDYEGMQACYADDARFSDPVFQNLNAVEVRKMWEMLITRGKDLIVEFSNVEAGEETASVDWKASYTFSATGKKVVNRIHATFVFENGKIARHLDHFSFYNWARQAMGFPGLLFGWTGFLQESVRQKARQNLAAFMKK